MTDSFDAEDGRPERPERPAYGDLRDDYDDEFGRLRTPAERAKRKMQGPAIAFIVLGKMGILGSLIGAIAVLADQYSRAMRSDERFAIMIVCVVLLLLGVALFCVVLCAIYARKNHPGSIPALSTSTND